MNETVTPHRSGIVALLHIALSCIASFACITTAFAAPGVPDPSFGTYGLSGAPHVSALTVQPDGRVLAGGSVGQSAIVQRLDIHGKPDATFGEVGVATVPLATGYASTMALALQPDGKILVAGITYVGAYEHGLFFVARFHPSGIVDSTFGAGGVTSSEVVPPTPPDGNITYRDSIESVGLALGGDGAIYLAALARRTLGNPVATLMRLDGRGTRDPSFADALHDRSLGVNLTYITGPVAQRNGKVVVAGRYYLPSGATGIPFDFAQRVQVDGTADPSFGTNGLADVPVLPSQLLLDDQGRLLVSAVESGPPALRVARLKADGTADRAFGTDGVAAAAVGSCGRVVSAHVDPCPYSDTSIVLQPDGKIVQVGVGVDPIPSTAIVRFDGDGRLDESFGIDGRRYETAQASGTASALDPSGTQLYTAPGSGQCCIGAIARFLLAPLPVALEASADTVGAGAPVTLSATLPANAAGAVSFFDEAGAIPGCVDLPPVASPGSPRATCTTAFAAGAHSLSAALLDSAGTALGASERRVMAAGEWPDATVTEYFYPASGDYFITSDPEESATLDASPAWQRTGQTFRVFPAQALRTRSMCRYYTAPEVWPATHFFGNTSLECSLDYPWRFEGDRIVVMTTDSNGVCADGTLPLYRMVDPKSSAHRYATDAGVRASMLAQGWMAEGLGIGVVACVLATPA